MYSYNELKKLTESLDMGSSLRDYDSSAEYSSNHSDEIERLENSLYRLESGDKEDFYEISGYEEYQYVDDDGVYDEAEFEKDLEIEINNIKKKIDKLTQMDNESYNNHIGDLGNRGVVSGKEIYKLMYTHTVGYHDHQIESGLIGGNSDELEFKTEANEILKSNGYDGLTHLDHYNPGEDKKPHRVFIAFDTNQVKSATGNNGNYDDSSKIINESVSDGTLIGYKMVNVEGDKAISLFDPSVKYRLIKGNVETGNIYLGTSEKFVLDYYFTDSDDPEDPDEALLTYEYKLSDIVKGNPEDKDLISGGGEIVVKRAKLLSAVNLTKKVKIV